MTALWVLLWLQVETPVGVNYFQLGSYESLQKCNSALERGKVMITTIDTQVVCVEIGVNSDD
jgi:hypothetical protein